MGMAQCGLKSIVAMAFAAIAVEAAKSDPSQEKRGTPAVLVSTAAIFECSRRPDGSGLQ